MLAGESRVRADQSPLSVPHLQALWTAPDHRGDLADWPMDGVCEKGSSEPRPSISLWFGLSRGPSRAADQASAVVELLLGATRAFVARMVLGRCPIPEYLSLIHIS